MDPISIAQTGTPASGDAAEEGTSNNPHPMDSAEFDAYRIAHQKHVPTAEEKAALIEKAMHPTAKMAGRAGKLGPTSAQRAVRAPPTHPCSPALTLPPTPTTKK